MLFKREWIDDDMIMLRAEICDGRSLFSTGIYVGFNQLASVAQGLNNFKTHIYGGLFNLRFGEFGCEYASGALDVRFHFVAQIFWCGCKLSRNLMFFKIGSWPVQPRCF